MKKDTLSNLFFSSLAILSLLLLDKDQHYQWLNRAIIFIYFIYILYHLLKSENKWAYIKSHPLELIALIPLNGVFQGAMLIRLFRLVVVIKALKKYFPRFTGILETNGLYKVLAFTASLIILAAIPINYFEEGINSFAEGIWWAIVTTTTVGYGDFAPVTTPGRITAVILMLVGIGCIGMITGSVATYLTKANKKDEDKEYIIKKINALEDLSEEEYRMLMVLIENKRHNKKS
ncbi:MAG: potassium channel family protein [Bacillus sp. (in: firmicutes)]